MSVTSTQTTSSIYLKSGLGGAGNYHPEFASSAIVSVSTPARKTSGTFLTGIGGAGNSRNIKDQVSLSTEEVRSREALRRGAAPAYTHYGIGGAGNRAASRSPPRSLVDGSSRASGESGRTSLLETWGRKINLRGKAEWDTQSSITSRSSVAAATNAAVV